ncbi:helix-turn-helix transcriptional regulator [Capnocytophaga granulosa]
MEKIIREFILLRDVRSCNRKGEFPKFQEIVGAMSPYVKEREDNKERKYRYDKQLFRRDREALEDKDCKIERNKENGYFFDEEGSELIDDLLTAYMLLTAQNKDGLLPTYVIPEPRRNTGAEHLPDCMHAIEEHYQLQLIYYDYRDEKEKTYTVQPYKLKHKDYKWYLLAVDIAHPEIPFKSFALERIRSIEEGESFSPNKQLDFVTPYRDAFGMFTDEQAERLVLEFDHRDGNYLIASPIHPSQRVVSKTNTRITFELYIKPTLDLIMELMKRSWSLTIVEPQHLREKFLKYWEEAIKRNKKVKREKY